MSDRIQPGVGQWLLNGALLLVTAVYLYVVATSDPRPSWTHFVPPLAFAMIGVNLLRYPDPRRNLRTTRILAYCVLGFSLLVLIFNSLEILGDF